MNNLKKNRYFILAAVVLSFAIPQMPATAQAAEPSLLHENETIMREKRMSTTNPLGLMDPSELPRPYESFMTSSPLVKIKTLSDSSLQRQS